MTPLRKNVDASLTFLNDALRELAGGLMKKGRMMNKKTTLKNT